MGRTKTIGLTHAAALAALSACRGGDDGASSGLNDTNPPAGSGVACTLQLDATAATTVAATKGTATMPAVNGGAIPAGTYVLTAVTYYQALSNGPDSFAARAVVVVDPTTFGIVRTSNGSTGVTRFSGAYSTSGATLTIPTNACAASGPPSSTLSYVMSGGELWLQGGALRLDKFTRQ